jgi:2'-5' RNA ligase
VEDARTPDAGRAPVVSIELLLDGGLEEAVRAEWAALAEAGLSSLGRHPSPSNRPHVTLLVRERLAPLDLSAALAGAAPALTLSGPVLFGTGERRVLARAVVPTARLIDLHGDVHRRAGPGADAPHTAPDTWMPHVTLARRLRLAALPDALALVGGEVRGTAVGLRRWDAAVSSVTELGCFSGGLSPGREGDGPGA